MPSSPAAGPREVLVLAPLRGFTGPVYRRLFVKHFGGVDRALAPFVPTVSSRRIPARLLADLLPDNNQSLPVEPQLMGTDPDDFVRMAQALADMGYRRVNWNLGCPFPMVAKKGRGSGLLPHPERIDAFLDAVLPRLALRLSVKMRLGRRDAGEIRRLIPVLNRYPLCEVTLHPRTGIQMYGGRVDLDAFAACQKTLVHPLIYNGDITTAADVRRLRIRFPGVAGWMIGRGAIADPFLPGRIKGTASAVDERSTFRAFHDDLLAAYAQRLSGPGHLLDRMKAYWTYFQHGFVNGRKVAGKIHRCRNMDRYRQICDRFFASDGARNHNFSLE